MIGLPKSTEFNRRIPKQKFYENLTVSPTLKRVFIDQIKVIYWRNKIAATTIGTKLNPIFRFHVWTENRASIISIATRIPINETDLTLTFVCMVFPPFSVHFSSILNATARRITTFIRSSGMRVRYRKIQNSFRSCDNSPFT